jgi:hypothetical protein
MVDAHRNVEFIGEIGDQEKAKLLGDATALLFSVRPELFGLVIIEAMARGTPVMGEKLANVLARNYRFVKRRPTGSAGFEGCNLSTRIRPYEERNREPCFGTQVHHPMQGRNVCVVGSTWSSAVVYLAQVSTALSWE